MTKTRDIPAAVDVNYEFVDGAHFFTSKSPLLRGLCVGSTDLKAAFDDLPIQVAGIFCEDHGVNVTCQAAISYHDFQRKLVGSLEDDLKAKSREEPAYEAPRSNEFRRAGAIPNGGSFWTK